MKDMRTVVGGGGRLVSQKITRMVEWRKVNQPDLTWRKRGQTGRLRQARFENECNLLFQSASLIRMTIKTRGGGRKK